MTDLTIHPTHRPDRHLSADHPRAALSRFPHSHQSAANSANKWRPLKPATMLSPITTCQPANDHDAHLAMKRPARSGQAGRLFPPHGNFPEKPDAQTGDDLM